MHTGSIVSIDSRIVHLKRSLLSPLCVQDGAIIYGMYYPSTNSDIVDERFTVKHDFMFTPVPPWHWPAVGRFLVFLKNEPGCIEGVTKYLEEHNVNILIAESTRSAHRYISITLTVVFEDLLKELGVGLGQELVVLTQEQKKHNLNRLRVEVSKIKDGISSDCKDYVFASQEVDVFGGVEGYVVNSLQYFYCKYCSYGDMEIYKPFEATVEQSKIVFKDMHSDGSYILQNIVKKDEPTYGFALTSTRDVNIRVAIIPINELEQYRKVKVEYVRESVPGDDRHVISTKGLLRGISGIFKRNNYNIWRLYNTTSIDDDDQERGLLEVIAQSMNDNSDETRLLNEIENFTLENDHDKKIQIKRPVLKTGINRFPIFLSIRNKDNKYVDHIKLCHKVGQEYGLLENDFIVIENPDKYVSDHVIEYMKRCKAVIQIHNIIGGKKDRDRMPSVWLEAEYLLALSLGIPVAQIVHRDLLKKLKIGKGTPEIDFTGSVKEDDIRKAIEKVIRDAVGRNDRI